MLLANVLQLPFQTCYKTWWVTKDQAFQHLLPFCNPACSTFANSIQYYSNPLIKLSSSRSSPSSMPSRLRSSPMNNLTCNPCLARYPNYEVLSGRVSSHSTLSVRCTLYTVPSRLVGQRLTLHLYHDHIIGFIGTALAVELPRLHVAGNEKIRRARCVNY